MTRARSVVVRSPRHDNEFQTSGCASVPTGSICPTRRFQRATSDQPRLVYRFCSLACSLWLLTYGGSVVMQNTTAQLDISNPVSRDTFLSNASKTLPQAHLGIAVECRPGIDASQGTSAPRMDEEPDTLECIKSAITALLCAVS